MAAELLKFALELLKLAPRYFVAFGTAAAFLLFAPLNILSSMGLEDFALENKKWLGLTLLCSAVLWCSFAVAHCWRMGKTIYLRRKVHGRLISKLHSMTESEKQIIRYYYAEETRTNVLRVDDGVVQGLVANRIIYRAASMGDVIEGFAHNITDVAWDYMHLHPEILDGTTKTYRTDKRVRGW